MRVDYSDGSSERYSLDHDTGACGPGEIIENNYIENGVTVSIDWGIG